jgi:CarD family transcriptional regulator, regulator of rRNA transcription
MARVQAMVRLSGEATGEDAVGGGGVWRQLNRRRTFAQTFALWGARERRVVLGKRQEVIVLALAGGLSVELPMERAHELLRPLASEADMSRVQQTLADHAVSRDPWLKRRRDSQAKLTGGDPIELAEIIRDSARREWTLPAKGTKSLLAPGERELFVKARQLLSNEIALARGVEPAEANAWIDEQLTRTG